MYQKLQPQGFMKVITFLRNVIIQQEVTLWEISSSLKYSSELNFYLLSSI